MVTIDQLRAILSADRNWSVYALADLDQRLFRHCQWFVSEPSTLALIYQAPDPPILFGIGEPEPFAELLSQITTPRVYLQIPVHLLGAVEKHYRIKRLIPMWRMRLEEPVMGTGPTLELSDLDLEDVEQLYRDGAAAGESPDFFFPEMLDRGVFRGIRENGELVAVAGTHVVSGLERVAAIGNVYTRRDRRGRGYGRKVTGGVVLTLCSMGIGAIALNVKQSNLVARRLYERLGFVVHCEYYEGLAEKRAKRK
ncbi:MAG: GNAT family N-acetyltransferase [Bryobacteraceae bacterium]